MWAFQLSEPERLDRISIDDPAGELAEDEVLIRFLAGGICGSDLPKFRGALDPDNPTTGQVGVPLHELVGTVVRSRSLRFEAGDHIVTHVPGARGLQELLVVPARFGHRWTLPIDPVHATMIQPLATVLSALDRVRPAEGRDVAVIGLGPLGLLFCHAAASAGARVTGIDRVDRHAAAEAFGISQVETTESRTWASAREGRAGFDLVIDAVGHRQEILADAVAVAEYGGEILVFGLPEDHYVLPMRDFFRKGLRLAAGANQDWIAYLARAEEYVARHPELPAAYITDVFGLDDINGAYARYGRPAAGRYKVVVDAGASA